MGFTLAIKGSNENDFSEFGSVFFLQNRHVLLQPAGLFAADHQAHWKSGDSMLLVPTVCLTLPQLTGAAGRLSGNTTRETDTKY